MAAPSNPKPKLTRCAVYTRKSTDEGLTQDFSSLDAQREAGESYVRSQVHEGWTMVDARYDDGGYTGADMNRPALKRLLADVDAGKVDCIVVYKVDRLSRSIRDFARMMESFDQKAISFVSVTQQFNTTSSLGRLTLNILLSFAQFEREIISERTKDKVTAARKKGKWTGGHLILGYDLDPRSRRLVVNSEEAERVREIFRLYLEGTSVTDIVRHCDRVGWRNKQWTTQDGKLYGGNVLRRCHVYNLLTNIVYSGRLKVGEDLFAGEHEGLIDEQTFDLVQSKLNGSPWRATGGARRKPDALLRGVLYCACCGGAMYSTWTANRTRRYRYYVCNRAQQKLQGSCHTRAVAAEVIEQGVVESIERVGVHPEVLAETARIARQRLSETVTRLRGELNAVGVRVKNLKSQQARIKGQGSGRAADLQSQIGVDELRAEQIRNELLRRERSQLDEKDLRRTMGSFSKVWEALNGEEQRTLLSMLIEKVGFDGRSGKITVSFKSEELKMLTQRGASR
jgi:site-specific DNA recombinase